MNVLTCPTKETALSLASRLAHNPPIPSPKKMALFSPGLTPARTGSGWWVKAILGEVVWEDRALQKSSFPDFFKEAGPGKESGRKFMV